MLQVAEVVAAGWSVRFRNPAAGEFLARLGHQNQTIEAEGDSLEAAWATCYGHWQELQGLPDA